MTAARRWLAAVASFVVTVAIVVGAPVGLWLAAGWTWPAHLPALARVGDALTHQWNPDTQSLIRILSIPCLLFWADLVLAFAVEVVATVSGRPGPRVTYGPLQTRIAQLVAAMVVVWVSASAMRPPAPVPALAGPAATPHAPTPVVATLTSATAHTPPPAAPAPAPAGTRAYVVRHGDTLWGIASRELGAGQRWHEIWELNRDRVVAPGVRLTDPEHLEEGMSLLLPAAAPSSLSGGLRVHVVKAGETLSEIAAQDLGSAAAYPKLVDLNEGHREPDGRVFGDPHWIDTGWPIIEPALPAPEGPALTPPAAPARPVTPATAPQHAALPPTLPPAPTPGSPPPSVPPAEGPRAPTSTSTATGVTGDGRGAATAPEPATTGSPLVQIPGVGIVAVAFAAGVTGAVALARRQAWRRWRPGDGGASVRAVSALVTPEIQRLEHAYRRSQLAVLEEDDDAGGLTVEAPPAPSPSPAAEPFRWMPPPHGSGWGSDEPASTAGDTGPAPVTEVGEPADSEVRRAGWIVVGELDGRQVSVDIGSLSGTGLVGPGAEAAVRAVALAFLVHAAVDEAEALAVGDTWLAVLPGIVHVPGVEVVPELGDLLSRLELEARERERILAEHAVEDFRQLAAEVPHEAAVAILAVAGPADDDHSARVGALVERGRRLGMAIVWLGASPVGPTLHLAADGTVDPTAGDVAEQLELSHLPVLDRLAAQRVIAVIAAARGAEPPPAPPPAEAPTADLDSSARGDHLWDPRSDGLALLGTPEAERPGDLSTRGPAPGGNGKRPPVMDGLAILESRMEPAQARVAANNGSVEHPPASDAMYGDDEDDDAPSDTQVIARVQVSVLGRLTLRGTDGVPIRPRGRPGPALQVIALLACNRPDPARPGHGATLQQALLAMYPDSSGDRARNTFKQAILTARRALRQGGPAGHIVLRSDGVYMLDPELVTVDLWEFEAAERALRAAEDPHARMAALTRMAGTYGGTLLDGEESWEWTHAIEEQRETLRGRAAEALQELAVRRQEAGETAAAIAAVEQAITAAPDAEELYQLMMRLQAAHGALARVHSTLRLWELRCSDLGVDVSEDTYALTEALLTAARDRR